MNSETHSCMHSFASFAIFAFSVKSGSNTLAKKSPSNAQAVLFPIRLLRLANAYGAGELPPFSELAAKVSLHNLHLDHGYHSCLFER